MVIPGNVKTVAKPAHSPFGSPQGRLFGWWREGDSRAHRAFIAASVGWMLDAFDVMLYSLVLASLMRDLNLTKAEGGLLNSVTLIASAAGGLLFGIIADRYGRKCALMGSVLMYSIFTGLCGFSQTLWQLAILRTFLGIGMGGEWASGAALVSESWPASARNRAFAFVQSSWAIGFGAAAIVAGLVLPVWGWRGVFFVGVLPALFVLWVQRAVEEPEIWKKLGAGRAGRAGRAGGAGGAGGAGEVDGAGGAGRARFSDLFNGSLGRTTFFITLMNACVLFGWWGLNTWVPAYLVLPPDQGGAGLSTLGTSGVVFITQIGMWCGYVSFGFISDALGRRRAYLLFLLTASVLLPLYGFQRNPLVLLALGPFVAFFGTGAFSGFGPLTAEIYPTAIRATAQGFTYNIGRIASAAAPFIVGSLATTRGFGVAFAVTGAAFLLASITWIWIPDTRRSELV
jgi:putative sialic acid transporter